MACNPNFIPELIAEASQIRTSTEAALVSAPREFGDQKTLDNMLVLLFTFCYVIDQLNNLLQYTALLDMWPLLLQVVQFQRDRKIRCDLLPLQAVRLHVQPYDKHNQLVRLVALSHADEVLPAKGRPGSLGPSTVLGRSERPTVAFAFFDVDGEHPIVQLTLNPLKELVKRDQINAYIIAIQEPNLEFAIVADLHQAFHAKKRWIQLKLPNRKSKTVGASNLFSS
jgi:hypothetical protein